MSVTAKLFSNFPHLLLEGKLGGDILSQTIKVALCTSLYSPDQDAHDYFDDISHEVSSSGTNYTAGGATVASKTCTVSGKVTTLDAADTAWSNSTITARYAILYYDSGSAATSLLIGYINFGTDMTSSNGTFQITWNASGIFTITVA